MKHQTLLCVHKTRSPNGIFHLISRSVYGFGTLCRLIYSTLLSPSGRC